MKKINLEKICAFLLGFTVCNNVIYAVQLGNTLLNIAFIMSIMISIYLIIFKKKNIFSALGKINIFFKIFLIIIVLSFFPMMIFCKDKSFYPSYISGLMYLIVALTIYINVFFLKDNKHYIYKGIVWGFGINIVLSIIQYVTYLKGNCFSLFILFPQDAFQVCNPALKSSLTMYISSYRAQGIFLETSYYMAFFGATILIFWTNTKKNIKTLGILIIGMFCIINSSSATMILIFIAIILYYITIRKKFPKEKYKKKNSQYILLSFLLVILIFLLLLEFNPDFKKVININEIIEKISSSITTVDVSNEDNSERADAMAKGLALIMEYPLGTGYNLMTKTMMLEYEGEMRVYTTFNYIITLAIEIGIIGAIVFICYIISLCIKLIFEGKTREKIAIGISAFITFLAQFACGFNFILIPFVLLIYGLADMESREDE